MDKTQFTNTYLPFAKQSESITGVSYLLTLSQAALESSWGDYAIGNNFFGIKCGSSWKGDRQLLKTTEIFRFTDKRFINADTEKVNAICKQMFPEVLSVIFNDEKKVWVVKVRDYFRKYQTPKDCFVDHGLFLSESKRYGKAIELFRSSDHSINSVYSLCDNISKSGYATDPDYSNKLKSLVKYFYAYMQTK